MWYHQGHDDEDKAVEENEGEELNLIDQNSSQHVHTKDLRCASASPAWNSQCGPSNGVAGAQCDFTPLASTQCKVMRKLPQVSKFRACVPALSAHKLAKKPHLWFRVEDLPDGSQQCFCEDLGPLWLDFISTLENP
ncbi:hypothetical protein BDR05DRAFT_1005350 [Suillus weaverae]|nr:hypothetical protein BDR05DRAFT_1005350 [Suillus weaverae]